MIKIYNSRIEQPKDKGIKLQDILETGVVDREKARALLESDSRPLKDQARMWHRYKSTGFTTIVYKNNEVLLRVKEATKKGYVDIRDKQCVDLEFPKSKTRGGRAMRDKVHTLTHKVNEFYLFENGNLRYFSQTELERCMTLPVGYTKILNRNKAASCLGNGWTVAVIKHIYKQL